MNPWPMVVADLRGMRWSAAAVALLVALAVASAVAIGAQERTLRSGSARAADDFDLVVGAPGSETQLVLTAVYLDLAALALVDGEVLNRLAADPRVAAVAPLAFGDVVRGAPVIGTSAAFVTRWGRVSPAEGRVFEQEGEAVIGADVALRVGESAVPSHAVGGHAHSDEAEEARHRHEGHSYRIVGRLPRLGSPYDRAILVPIESVWEVHGLGNGHAAEGRIGPPFEADRPPGIPAIVVKPRGVADAYALRAAYRGGGTVAVFPAEVLVALYRTMGEVRDALVVASWLNTSLVFAALALLVLTLTGLRRRRYAVLRALGAPAAYILAVVWLGAAMLVAAGGAAGLLLGWAGAVGVSAAVEARTGLRLAFRPEWSDGLLVLGLVALGAVVAGLPALAAYRRPVDAALRV